jgi:PKHD-type hydroxylase
MILPYSYWYFQSALPPDACDKILEHGIEQLFKMAENHGEKAISATTGDWRQKDSVIIKNSESKISLENLTTEDLRNQGLSIDDVYLRDSNVVFLNDRWLFDLILPYVHEANKQAGWNFQWDTAEDLQFTRYREGQFYGWHADAGSAPYELYRHGVDKQLTNANGELVFDIDGEPVPENSNQITNAVQVGKIRKISVTISLSKPETYAGGNLRFDFGPHYAGERYHTCEEIRPQGSIIVFPSHIYHQVTPVTSGTRYSLVAWIIGHPFV